MTIQQMEYIVALDTYRHFVLAAEACSVTQPTLSSMIQKLETEIDTTIFDRKSHPVRPTPMGERLIAQARVVLHNLANFKEIALAEKTTEQGSLRLGVIPTVAPYIVPQLIAKIGKQHPLIDLHIAEMRTDLIVTKLKRAQIDVAILATPLDEPELLEIPLFYEKFIAYLSPDEPLYAKREILSSQMPSSSMWVLQEGHCLRGQVLNFCDNTQSVSTIYQAGSIETLIRIVEQNGGYTIIPELQLGLLTTQQLANTRPLISPTVVREISLVVRRDYVRQGVLNVIAQTIKGIVPTEMVDEHLKKFAIKL